MQMYKTNSKTSNIKGGKDLTNNSYINRRNMGRQFSKVKK